MKSISYKVVTCFISSSMKNGKLVKLVVICIISYSREEGSAVAPV
jgi:hypothetical protein